MKPFLYSKRILIKPDQSLDDVKEFLKTTLGTTMDLTEVGPGTEQFTVQGTTGSLFDFIRRAHTSAEYTMMAEDTKNGRELRIMVSGSSSITYSLITVYLVLFLFIMAVGLLPGSIETSGEESDAIDALVFLLIGLYIKLDIDRGLKDASETMESALGVIETRFGI